MVSQRRPCWGAESLSSYPALSIPRAGHLPCARLHLRSRPCLGSSPVGPAFGHRPLEGGARPSPEREKGDVPPRTGSALPTLGKEVAWPCLLAARLRMVGGPFFSQSTSENARRDVVDVYIMQGVQKVDRDGDPERAQGRRICSTVSLPESTRWSSCFEHAPPRWSSCIVHSPPLFSVPRVDLCFLSSLPPARSSLSSSLDRPPALLFCLPSPAQGAVYRCAPRPPPPPPPSFWPPPRAPFAHTHAHPSRGGHPNAPVARGGGGLCRGGDGRCVCRLSHARRDKQARPPPLHLAGAAAAIASSSVAVRKRRRARPFAAHLPRPDPLR